MSAVRLSLIGALVAGSAVACADSSLQWISANVFKRIQITGQRVLGYHIQSLSGDGDAFNALTYYGQGGKQFTDYGQINLVGQQVLGVFNFRMQLQNNRFGDPTGQKISLNYHKGGYTVDLGDIQGSLLNTNQFASFNKTLVGASAGFERGRVQVKAVRSSVKGSVQTVSIAGNGSPGPYYLNANQIIPDSEKILVDGIEQRLGTDYSINYEVGSITFSGKSIAQTSTIVASYETYSYNTNRGTVQGMGIAYNLGRFGRLGLTSIEQLVGGNRQLTTRDDYFQGFGAPATPYYLQYTPLPGLPIVVRVDGAIQTLGIDYIFDQGNPSIFYFLRFMPSTSTIDVTYTPAPTQAVNGDRKVFGFDYRIPLGKGGQAGSLSYSQATGRLLDNLTPLSGTARGITASYKFKGLNFKAALRDVPQGFVGIETTGFNRNEKATELAVEGGKPSLRYGISNQNSLVSTAADDGKGNLIFSTGRITYTRAYAHMGTGDAAWSLEQAHSTSTGASGDSRMDTTSLSNTRHLGKLALSTSLQHLNGMGPLVNQLGTTQGTISSDSLQLKADYDPGHSLTLSGRTSVSSIRTNGQSGRGTDMSLALGYHPSGPFSTDVAYSLSRSGELAALSQFQNGLGFGYGGNGFSQAPTGTPFANSGTDVTAFQALSSYRLSGRSNLEAHFIQAETQGDVSSNTKSVTFGGGLQFDLGNTNALNVALDQTKTAYFGTDTNSAATTFDAYISGSPIKRWTYRLGSSILLSSGNEYSQNRYAFDGGLTRRIKYNETLSLQFQSGTTSGYLPQTDGFVGLYFSHQLYRTMALTAGYTLRNLTNLDPTQTTGGYRVRGFDLQLTFNFGR